MIVIGACGFRGEHRMRLEALFRVRFTYSES